MKSALSGGNGGGIIWISSNGTTSLYNSKFLAEGSDGKEIVNKTGSGGGSGGSIQLTTNVLAGNSFASVKGGDGSIGGGGGGSGGRI